MSRQRSVFVDVVPIRALLVSVCLLGLASRPALAGDAVGWGDNTYGKATAPSGVQFTQISSSEDSSVGIRADGTLMAWGNDGWGEVSQVPAGTFTAVASGRAYHVAIRTDGSLVAWGDPYAGGTSVPLGSFKAVAGGAYNGFGLKTDGSLVAWGDGTVPLPSGSYLAIATDASIGYAIREDRTLVAFPLYSSGGSATPPTGTFSAIAGGGYFVIGLRTDGTLVGWGNNQLSQINVPSGTFSAIACGGSFSVGLRTDGTLVHWGDYANQLHDVPSGQFDAVSAGSYANNAFAIRSVSGQSVQWTQRQVSGPSPRYQSAMAYDSARGATVLFGGDNFGNGMMYGDTWEWNGTAWNQRAAGGPSPREAHAMAYDSARGVTVLFGGAGVDNSTWEWNGTAWNQRAVTGPSSRYNHAMVYDAARGVTVLFGGSSGGDETWEWNGLAWTQRLVSGPDSRHCANSMAYDAARGVTVLFGGTLAINNISVADTWEWNGTAWNQRMVSGPSQRTQHAMAYDTARGVTVLFGGADPGSNAIMGDTWEWNGTAWTQRMVNGPSARDYHAMAYDNARGVSVLFGGYTASGSYSGETWELGGSCATPPSITSHPVPQSLAVNQTAMFSVAATGPNIGYQWRKSSVNLSDGGRISGSTTAMLTITSVQTGDQGSYDCVVTNPCNSVTSNPATLSVVIPCTVTQQPSPSILNCGGYANFTTAVSGSGTPTYRWRWGGTNLNDGATGHGSFVIGSTTASMYVVNARSADSGGYDCVITSDCGTVTSAVAALTVRNCCRADFDGSGQVTIDDIFIYLNAWFSGCP